MGEYRRRFEQLLRLLKDILVAMLESKFVSGLEEEIRIG